MQLPVSYTEGKSVEGGVQKIHTKKLAEEKMADNVEQNRTDVKEWVLSPVL